MLAAVLLELCSDCSDQSQGIESLSTLRSDRQKAAGPIEVDLEMDDAQSTRTGLNTPFFLSTPCTGLFSLNSSLA